MRAMCNASKILFPLLLAFSLMGAQANATEERSIPKMPGQQQDISIEAADGEASEAPADKSEGSGKTAAGPGAPGAKGAPQRPMGPMDFLSTFGIFIIMIPLFYFLAIRPQQKQAQDRKKMLESIKTGDEVQLGSGILGTVRKIKDDIMTIQIAEGVDVRVKKEGVSIINRTKEG